MLSFGHPLRLRGAPEALAMKVPVEVVVPHDFPPSVPNSRGIGDRKPSDARGCARPSSELQVHVNPVVRGEEDPKGLPFGHFMAKWTLHAQILQLSVSWGSVPHGETFGAMEDDQGRGAAQPRQTVGESSLRCPGARRPVVPVSRNFPNARVMSEVSIRSSVGKVQRLPTESDICEGHDPAR